MTTIARALVLLSFCIVAPSHAVQVCELGGQSVNPSNGSTTQGKTGLMRCREADGGPVVREQELKNGMFMGIVRYFKEGGLTDVPFYRGRGCPHCRGTGYRGRIGFHELVLITEEIRQLITERRSAQEITRAAAKVGYRPLRYDGLRKVLLGLTTIEEIEQNTSFEWAT